MRMQRMYIIQYVLFSSVLWYVIRVKAIVCSAVADCYGMAGVEGVGAVMPVLRLSACHLSLLCCWR